MGGLLLLYVVVKLYRDLRAGTHDHESLESAAKIVTLRSAITSIIIADVSMSLDNVLAVAGAAHGNTAALGIGLIISIILMAVASNYMATLLKRYPWIAWLGLLVLLYVTLQMLYQGYIDAATRLFV